jgi:hypothetical protein
METLTSQEFFAMLKTNSLKTTSGLKGIVKKSEKDTELLFTKKGDFHNWIKIPSSMVESVKMFKTFTKEDITYAVVKLQLKTPSNPEGKVLYELLSSLEKSGRDDFKGGYGHYGMRGKYCEEGAYHSGHHCGCGCHHEANCKCGCNQGHHEEHGEGGKYNREN